MHLNSTIFGQMITFAILVWFTAHFIWPYLMDAIEKRQHIIAQGLRNAEHAQLALVQAQEDAKQIIIEAKTRAEQIIVDAQKEEQYILAEAKQKALTTKNFILAEGMTELAQNTHKIRNQLQLEFGKLVFGGVAKVLKRSVNQQDHQILVDELSKKIVTMDLHNVSGL